jgi:hypothetical protein
MAAPGGNRRRFQLMVIHPVCAARSAAVLALAPMAPLALQQADFGGQYDRIFMPFAAFSVLVVGQARLRGARELLGPEVGR